MRPEGAARAAEVEDALRLAGVSLGRALREAGMSTCVESELVFSRALGELDPRRREHVYWAARAAMLQRPEQLRAFEAVFERFWEGRELLPPRRGAEHGETDPRASGPQHGGEALPQFRPGGRASALVDGGSRKASREIPSGSGDEPADGGTRGRLAAYSPSDSSPPPEPVDYAGDELRAVRELEAELRRAMPRRRSRRLRPAATGRPDIRRTVHRSLRSDGEALRLAFAAPSERPRRLLIVCDVSGSMDRYSRVLLASLRGAVAASRRTEAFAFATRLTRITPQLGEGELARALESARERVPDWSGGTRIGEILREFNRSWGRRGYGRGAIVIVVSDGWDRGDPELLATELARLRRQSRHLVWVNPRPGEVAAQPLAVGLRAALPQVDEFIPGHDARAIAGLGRVIAGLGKGRPTRRRGGDLGLDSIEAGKRRAHERRTA